MLVPTAIMRPLAMTEEEFWELVKSKLKRGNYPLLEATEAVRDEYDIHQNHIATMTVRIGFICFDKHGHLPPKIKTLRGTRALIDEHIKRIES